MNIIEKYRYNKKMKEDTRNFDEELIQILKRDLKDDTLECFRFMDTKQVKEVIQRNYKNVNETTLIFAVCKIVLIHFLDDFRKYREHEEKTDFIESMKELQGKEG